ncbi:hypothetical protein [uncultured Tateyamaria sp.]|uniref:hypothetical protein n=1 Tax=uncultured Tateyamaria sp. TaxID=455651 RepID=UPI002624E317|nr:hypothetical protein [uncultured Tateyamaria sp.]
MAKKRSYKAIKTRVHTILNPDDPNSVRFDEKVSKYYSNILAFLAALNAHPGFVKDGMKLAPADVVDDPSVADIRVAVIGNYQRRGWDVT